jgi:hypothetical protein
MGVFLYPKSHLMKINFLIVMLCVSAIACKSKKEAAATTTATPAPESGAVMIQAVESSEPATTGKVSHRYKTNGCSVIIIVVQDADTTVLIPKDKLAKEFDVDGKEISFNYTPLKMPQPAGCGSGMPVTLSNIKKK